MDVEQLYQLTDERLAAVREQAVRDLVQANAMLNDELAALKDEIRHLRVTLRACGGCVWWNDWKVTPRCENDATPEPWRSAAFDGGVPACPNHAPACATCKVAQATGDEVVAMGAGTPREQFRSGLEM